MKYILTLLLSFSVGSLCAQTTPAADTVQQHQIVEAACGQCKLGLKGKGCSLAVRIEGKAYFVDGTSIDEHGDAHAKDGFCNAIRQAKVRGKIVNGRYQVTEFKLVKP